MFSQTVPPNCRENINVWQDEEKKMTEFETVKLSFLPGFPDVSIYCKTKEEGKVRQVFEEEQKVSEGKEPKGEQEPPLFIEHLLCSRCFLSLLHLLLAKRPRNDLSFLNPNITLQVVSTVPVLERRKLRPEEVTQTLQSHIVMITIKMIENSQCPVRPLTTKYLHGPSITNLADMPC